MTTFSQPPFTPSLDDVCDQGPALVLVASIKDEELGCIIGNRHQDAAGDGLSLVVITGSRASGHSSPLDPASGQPSVVDFPLLPPPGFRQVAFWAEPLASLAYGEKLITRLCSLINESGFRLVYAPWPFDPDPMRATLALVVREAVRRAQHQCVLVLYRVAEPDQLNHIPTLATPEISPWPEAQPAVTEETAPAQITLPPLASNIDDHPVTNLPEVGSTEAQETLPESPPPPKPIGMAVEFSRIPLHFLTQPVPNIARHWPCPPTAPDDDQPLVSVVIRSANRPELADALDSIALQTYPAIEVVVADVEGQSRLKPGPLCGPFPTKLASTGQHLGRGTAANVGLSAASGMYAIFLDDDDWFLPDHICTLVSALQEHQGCSAAYAGVECQQRDEGGHWRLLHVFNSPHDPIRLLIQNYLPIHAVLFERKLFGRNLRFDESLHVYEDWDFWVQLSQKTDFLHIDRISAIYRISDASGFGVKTDEALIIESLSLFFAKWRQLWTIDQIIAIARYATNHAPPDDLTSAIQAHHSHLLTKIKSRQALPPLNLNELRAYFPVEMGGEANYRAMLEEKQAELDAWHENAIAHELALNDAIARLEDVQNHDRLVGEALQNAESRLATTQCELRTQRERAETLERVSSHLIEKISAIGDQLSDSETCIKTLEARRREEYLQLFRLQENAYWPILTQLSRLGDTANRLLGILLGTVKFVGWTLSFRLPSAWRRRALSKRLLASGLFDPAWYLQKYPEVLFVGFRPIYHWLCLGWRQGYDPHPLFSTRWYLEQYPDVAQAGVDPLLHYLQMGAGEGRDPHPLFDSDWYLQQNPDVAQQGMNPLSHFIQQGFREGRSPHPLFDLNWYLEQYPDVAALGINPLIHYVEYGQREGRIPHPSIIHGEIPIAADALAGLPVAVRDKGGHDNVLVNIESLSGDLLRASNRVFLKGWLIAWSGVQQASILIDGLAYATLTRTLERPDVFAKYPDVADASKCGFELQLDLTALTVGEHILSIQVRTRLGSEMTRPIRLLIERPRDFRLHAEVTSSPTPGITPPPLIDWSDDELDQAARTLVLDTLDDPEISILIPVYNQVRFSLACLGSIAAHPPRATIEVIVIDDASTDDTPRLLAQVQGIRYVRNESNLGFLRSVNRGAGTARGRYINLLNNDTQVQPGWLDALLDVFRDEPATGIAGSKLIYPSGHLQEAGAALKRDGRVDLIGLNQHPALPAYNRRRRVDHCSGASILIEKALFDRLDGLDEAYAPAYYEDCDLSLRVRALGREVVYEPGSVVVHHLSVTTAAQPGEKMDRIARNSIHYLNRWQTTLRDLDAVYLIAFYLPQFHPIPENDRWWGKGFTDWTNVSRAKPNFQGHEQPHLPADLGYYDLRLPEVRQAQADLARRYGIYGFCYYNYWFNGHRLLHQPIDAILASGEPDFPFCICWANENWTRRWDGKDDEILIGQDYSEADNLAYIRHLDPWLRDRRYIRINGRPLLLVYRLELLPDPARTAAIWRDYCQEAGIGAIYLASVESFGTTGDPRDFGFDATVEFPPHERAVLLDPQPHMTNPHFVGLVYDYPATADHFKSRILPDYPFFRTAMPSWDNTARRQDTSHIFVNATPELYGDWLAELVQETRTLKAPGERLVFINAWNEWAEGNHLEPDQRYGHGYLEASRRALGHMNPSGFGEGIIQPRDPRDLQGEDAASRARPALNSTLLEAPPGVLLVGHPYAVLGRAEDIRAAARACDAASIPFALRNVFGDYGRQWADLHQDFPLMDRLDPLASYRANLFVLNANEMASIPQQLGKDFMAGHYNIGYWAWELSGFPDAWLPALAGLDEIWAPSKFVEQAVSAKTDMPVIWMPLAVEPGDIPLMPRQSLGLPERRFLFLFFFDFRSFVSRKNPQAVMTAFQQAFGSNDDRVGLVIKTNGMVECPEAYQAFKDQALTRHPRIHLVDRVMDDRELKGLMNQCDAFVSLHRSEGFGRGLAEAMYLGKPVIATAYSGNLDFMNPANSCLVDYTLVPVGENDYPFGQGQYWAEANIDMAVAYMRALVADPALAREKGARAALDVRRDLGFDAIGQRYRQRFEELGLIEPLKESDKG